MDRDLFLQCFPGQANSLVARYGAPVFLVGSLARGDKEPRDIDIVVVLADSEMKRLYGHRFPLRSEKMGENETWEWRRTRDNLKQSRSLKSWGGLPVDFKVQSEMEALAHADCPRVRVDTAPGWVFLDERFTNYDTVMMRDLLGLPKKEGA